MTSNKVRLGDIAEIVMGQSPKGDTCNNDGHGMPLLNGPTEFGTTHPYPTQFTTDAKKISLVGDILFCVRGSTTGRMNYGEQEYAIGRGIGAIRGKNGYSTAFVKSVIESNLAGLLKIATGTTFPNLGKDALNNFEVDIVDSDASKFVGQLAEQLENKIASNKLMSQTLEKIAQRIFKSWFIDFDPTKANNQGIPFDGLSPEIQALFPNEFEDSELGGIPKGWEVSTVKQLQEKLSKGTTPRKKDVESAQDTASIPFIKVRNISDKGFIESELETVAKSIHEGALKRSILQSADLLFTIAGTIGRVAIVPDRLNNSNCNQAVCFIRLKDKSTYNNYLYLHLKSKRVQEQISSKVVQAVQANASLQNINDINFPLPPSKLMESWNKVSLPLFDRIKEIEKQNITLKSLRDKLLPKLTSGQISVGETKKHLAAAI
ncbi:restriction endonuclease subunit S [Vibrio harveyi]|uniref:restriction endonuclease subunit S n=1 Tax=Vibrio harveyi TaxID=669 RepID=UPI001EFDD870|nr:restriction endonuclease subunit S [Vibrio harveyi]MCG9235854.1 restriction endonuclease subunit S [Vibrio harveyi]MCG9586087.1 restriction endonuclease subunit S [Vibrio harveyi]